jgi:23S rRNA pseudoU1915 N3-methylase RlmH
MKLTKTQLREIIREEIRNSNLIESKVSGWDVDPKFRAWISDTLRDGDYPTQSPSFAKFIDSGKKSGTIQLSFVKEVKDGRSSYFNENDVLKLKGSTFTYNTINILISNVILRDTDVDRGSSSDYYRFYYTLDLKRK